MPPNGMPLNNMNNMQRPQAGNPVQQLHAKILHELQQSMNLLNPGWQTTFDVKQRANKIMQLYVPQHCLLAHQKSRLTFLQNHWASHAGQ